LISQPWGSGPPEWTATVEGGAARRLTAAVDATDVRAPTSSTCPSGPGTDYRLLFRRADDTATVTINVGGCWFSTLSIGRTTAVELADSRAIMADIAARPRPAYCGPGGVTSLTPPSRNQENAVLIVCPNLAVDHTISIPSVHLGAVQRTGRASSVAGGKGANVARAALALGGRPRVLGFTPQQGAAYLRELFSAEGMSLIGIEVAGAVRTCTALVEESGRVSLLNEPGPDVTDADWQRLLEGVDPAERAVIGTGSLPPGAPADGYARLVAVVHTLGGECSVDTSGPALRAAAADGADLLCPNVFEATSVLSGSIGSSIDAEEVEVDERDPAITERAMDAAGGLLALGAGRVAVTAGAAGVAFVAPGASLWLPTVPVKGRNPIGAGDSLLAGAALARERGAGWVDAVRFGMATAASSVENSGAGVVDAVRVAELQAQLRAAHRVPSA
jgi:1-phosphofructokinase family hexose kinase